MSHAPRPVKTYHTKSYDRICPSNTKFDAEGKTVLIAGGATGIGFSISQSFAEAGVARIIIVSRSAGPQDEAKKALTAKFPKTEIQTVQASLSNTARIAELLDNAGDIDVLVLSAATSHAQMPALNVTKNGFDSTIATNVLAQFSTVQEYLKRPTPKSGTKTVIHVSSGAAHVARPNLVAYGPSKAAMSSILQNISTELTPEKDGVRLFTFHPGMFLTPMSRSAGYSENDEFFGAEDIKLPADFAVWCAGPESTFLSGRFLWAHWDVDELIALKDRVEKDPSFLRLGLVQ